MAITGNGWEFHVQRLGLHKRMHQVRTYGSYEVFKNGESQASTDPLLKGFVCETIGPGKNRPAGNGLRIEQGTYPLTTQFGRYVSIGFSTDTHIAANPHMPGIALTGTGERVGVLIHPGHPKNEGDDPPVAYVSSIGCFNPTRALTRNDDINFFESRLRVIALINSLKAFFPGSFQNASGQPILSNTAIARASAVVDGEPMNFLDDDTPVA